ncbi:hypothetical protein HAX54_045800 [Datura stramonium]|uniref:Uncharacterized protein n=1 Tax=Datura stramonium TaxID=4076 RepID=A0ABS8WIC7_DATST|nr:hypothetical protein [Datura stramonium]
MVRTCTNGVRETTTETVVVASAVHNRGHGRRPTTTRGQARTPTLVRERSLSPITPIVQERVAVEVEVPTQAEALAAPAFSKVLAQVLNILSGLVDTGAAPPNPTGH